jgi:hypothetical protein
VAILEFVAVQHLLAFDYETEEIVVYVFEFQRDSLVEFVILETTPVIRNVMPARGMFVEI